MGYDIILLDADETLFDYSRAERVALEHTCEAFGAPFDSRVLEQYHQINDALWKQFEQGAVTQDALRVRRFESLFAFLGIKATCTHVNRFYTRAFGEGAFLTYGAEDFCRTLSAKRPLYIVTNGVAEVQRSRLTRASIAPYIRDIFISQEIGAPKPRAQFLDHVFAALGNPSRARVIIMGDSLTSDMAGGKNAGVATCWFAPDDAVDTVGCDYRVSRLADFLPIALGA